MGYNSRIEGVMIRLGLALIVGEGSVAIEGRWEGACRFEGRCYFLSHCTFLLAFCCQFLDWKALCQRCCSAVSVPLLAASNYTLWR